RRPTMPTATTTVYYKDRPYLLLWKGRTKFGGRAHLAFPDNSKDFWVDASAVSDGPTSGSTPNPRRSATGSVCAECGNGGALVHDLEDGLLKHYRCCD